jgi:hypothetical protein
MEYFHGCRAAARGMVKSAAADVQSPRGSAFRTTNFGGRLKK